jgi:hypothetical protein
MAMNEVASGTGLSSRGRQAVGDFAVARSEGALLGASSEHAAKAPQTVDRSREAGA